MEAELKPITDFKSYNKVQFILESSKHLFKKFSTEQKRFTLYENESLYVPPQNFIIVQESHYVPKPNGEMRLEIKPVTAVHIFLPETLQKVFQTPGVLKEMLKYTEKLFLEKTLSNFIQGEVWLKKIRTTQYKQNCLSNIFYYDEFGNKKSARKPCRRTKIRRWICIFTFFPSTFSWKNGKHFPFNRLSR